MCAVCRAAHSFHWAAITARNAGKDVPDPFEKLFCIELHGAADAWVTIKN